ncbi:MAG: Na+/H+ antiporter, partial [Betaproteobacteria bacterium]
LQLAQMRLEQLAANKQIAPEALAVLRARHDDRFGRLPSPNTDRSDPAAAAANVRSDLIALERQYIYGLLREGRITDEARRRIERELDLEEADLATKKEGGIEPPL